jgi:hypothetical protein
MFTFLNTFKNEIFITTVITVHYLFYILIYLNIAYISISYINFFNVLLQISISLFLIIRFVFKKKNTVISMFDIRVILSCASFMLLNSITNYFFEKNNKGCTPKDIITGNI